MQEDNDQWQAAKKIIESTHQKKPETPNIPNSKLMQIINEELETAVRKDPFEPHDANLSTQELEQLKRISQALEANPQAREDLEFLFIEIRSKVASEMKSGQTDFTRAWEQGLQKSTSETLQIAPVSEDAKPRQESPYIRLKPTQIIESGKKHKQLMQERKKQAEKLTASHQTEDGTKFRDTGDPQKNLLLMNDEGEYLMDSEALNLLARIYMRYERDKIKKKLFSG